MGKAIDKRITELGGIRKFPISLADEATSLEETVEVWKKQIISEMRKLISGFYLKPSSLNPETKVLLPSPDKNASSSSVSATPFLSSSVAVSSSSSSSSSSAIVIPPETTVSAFTWCYAGESALEENLSLHLKEISLSADGEEIKKEEDPLYHLLSEMPEEISSLYQIVDMLGLKDQFQSSFSSSAAAVGTTPNKPAKTTFEIEILPPSAVSPSAPPAVTLVSNVHAKEEVPPAPFDSKNLHIQLPPSISSSSLSSTSTLLPPPPPPPSSSPSFSSSPRLSSSSSSGIASSITSTSNHHSYEHPFHAAITNAYWLTEEETAQSTLKEGCDIEKAEEWGKTKRVIGCDISLKGSHITYQPGDSIGICCPNLPYAIHIVFKRLQSSHHPDLSLSSMIRITHPTNPTASSSSSSTASSLLNRISASYQQQPPPSQSTEQEGELIILEELLKYRYDLMGLPKKAMITTLASCCQQEDERKVLLLLAGKDKFSKSLWSYFIEKQGLGIAEILFYFPSCQPTLKQLLSLLLPIPPRYYSITTSPLNSPESVSIAFAVVRNKYAITADHVPVDPVTPSPAATGSMTPSILPFPPSSSISPPPSASTTTSPVPLIPISLPSPTLSSSTAAVGAASLPSPLSPPRPLSQSGPAMLKYALLERQDSFKVAAAEPTTMISSPSSKFIRRIGICTTYLEYLLSSFLYPNHPIYGRKEEKADSTTIVHDPSHPHHHLPHIRVFHKPTLTFHLPGSVHYPLLLIGPGTGVAPFLSFLEHRMEIAKERQKHRNGGELISSGVWRGGLELGDLMDSCDIDLPCEGNTVTRYINSVHSPGKISLFYGCRNEKDYLFHEKLEDYFVKNKVLTELSVAFSRMEGKEKQYVTHKLKERKIELGKMIVEESAFIYICGDGTKMAKDVQAILREVLIEYYQEKKGKDGKINVEETVNQYWNELKTRRRLLLDIWS
jgi:sulfite reductase alpha subunit-like flavoprotein